MGLDARVYCDCFEKGRLLEPPPPGFMAKLEPDGSLSFEQDPAMIVYGFPWDEWREERACEHKGGVFLHHRLGNIGLIALIRSELKQKPIHFPILLERVVYSGSHGGDFLDPELIPSLQRELKHLEELHCDTREAAVFLGKFRIQMSELASTALLVNKPISF